MKKTILAGVIALGIGILPITHNVYAYANETVKIGMKNDSVITLQKELKALGYFDNKVTGYFGNITKESVKKFQKDHLLVQDGIAGRKTWRALSNKSIEKTTVSRGGSESRNLNLTWFENITNIVPRETVFKVTDVYTGKVFNAKRTYGTNHADSEVLTKEDADIMKSLYGNKWSWERRPVIIEVNGMKLPASMAGMPHGSDFIGENGMQGHFDIHFLGSKTHGTNRIDEQHQQAVKIASTYIK